MVRRKIRHLGDFVVDRAKAYLDAFELSKPAHAGGFFPLGEVRTDGLDSAALHRVTREWRATSSSKTAAYPYVVARFRRPVA